jgi:hypothetical protein
LEGDIVLKNEENSGVINENGKLYLYFYSILKKD